MSKVIKIVIGAILLLVSAFYFLGMYLVSIDAREEAVYYLGSYLQIEQTDCEYLGENVEIYGKERKAEEGYGFYKLSFQVENLSSVSCHGGFDSSVMIEDDAGEVGQIIIFPDSPEAYYTGIYSSTTAILPGKTRTHFAYYVEVKEGVDRLHANYWPTWDGEPAELEIELY